MAESTSSDFAVTRKRLAFIVANAEYIHLVKWEQAVKDAELIQTTLQNIGFKTYLYKNLTTEELIQESKKFKHLVDENDLVIYYFNGHGIQHIEDDLKDDYLLGIEAQAGFMNDKEEIQGLALRKLIRMVQRDRFVMIFFFDAGRYVDNYYRSDRNSGTFDSIMTQEIGQPSTDLLLQLDLTPEDTDIDLYQVDIVYACKPGKFTLKENSKSEHGYLARALHHSLSKAGGWHDAIPEATAQVVKETYRQQRPSAEINIMHKLEIKDLAEKSEFGFDFENIESASVEKIFVQDCVKSGFRLKNIQLVTMKDIHASDCSVGIDGNDVKAVNFDDILVEKCVFGFGIQKCDGQLTNYEFKECDVEIYQVSGKFQQYP